MRTLIALLFVGSMCGDCNHNGEVTIAEAIQVISAMLNPPPPCDFGCINCSSDEVCWELFDCWSGPVSFCASSESTITRCGQEAACEVE